MFGPRKSLPHLGWSLLVLSGFLNVFTVVLRADVVVLYDGNGLPASQPWLSFASDSILSGGTASQSAVAGGVSLTTDLAVSAGYSNYNILGFPKNNSFPTLNRANGFELSFALSVNSENHTSTNRAGHSVILLGSDAKGIELAFWGDQIWAQQSNPLFTHGETVNFNTSGTHNYRVRIQNDAYELFDGANSLLTGSTRDYSAFGSAPYNLPNFLFLGDNTSSGAANVRLGPITLNSNLSAVPEPSSLLLSTLGTLLAAVVFQYRRRTSPIFGHSAG